MKSTAVLVYFFVGCGDQGRGGDAYVAAQKGSSHLGWLVWGVCAEPISRRRQRLAGVSLTIT